MFRPVCIWCGGWDDGVRDISKAQFSVYLVWRVRGVTFLTFVRPGGACVTQTFKIIVYLGRRRIRISRFLCHVDWCLWREDEWWRLAPKTPVLGTGSVMLLHLPRTGEGRIDSVTQGERERMGWERMGWKRRCLRQENSPRRYTSANSYNQVFRLFFLFFVTVYAWVEVSHPL